MPEPVYTMTLSSRQARLMVTALDFWDRCHGGQLDELRDCAHPGVDRSVVREAVDELARVLRPDLSPGAADFNFPGGQLAFNLRKALEHVIWWHEHPPTEGQHYLTPYRGPMDGWWEGEPPVVVTVSEPTPIKKKGRA